MWILGIILQISLVIGILIVAYIQDKKRRDKMAEERAEQEAIEAEKIKQEMLAEEKQREADKAEKIYRKFAEMGIENFDDERSKEALRIVANSFSISTDSAKDYFFKGRTVAKQSDYDKLQAARSIDKASSDKVYQMTKLHGKAKYLDGVEEKYKKLSSKAAGMAALARVEQMEANNPRIPKTTDWAIAGGLASGIAGPAAGLAAAANAQAENARNLALAESNKQTAQELANDFSSQSYDAQYEADKIKRGIDAINNKLIDDSDINEKFKLMRFENAKFSVNKNKNIQIRAEIKYNQPIELFGKPAILDGSLKITVFDSSNNTVATGYYCAPGFGKLDLASMDGKSYYVGFIGGNKSYDRNELKALCIVDNYQSINENDKFTCKFEPVDLWVIEQ